MLEEFHDVEEIAGVLSIQSGNELSAVNVFGCKNWNLKVGEQGIAGQGRQIGPTHAMNRATHDRVDLDFYFGSATSNHQLRLAVTTGLRHIYLESPCSQPSCRVSDSSADSGKRFLSPDSVIDKDQIQIDGQSGHVPKEQIDRRTALEPELIVDEHQRCYLDQQTRGL